MTRKTAVIVGASSDIGLSISEKFAEKGYNLVLTYNENNLDFENFLKKYDIDIKKYHLNLLNDDSIKKFFEELKKDYKFLDCMIFCAGKSQKRTLLIDLNDEEIENIYRINLISATKCIKEFVKIKTNNSPSSIVLLGSFVEKNGCSCESVYTASKTALTGLCKSMVEELAPFNTRINVVAPGFIDTKMNNNLSREEKEEIASDTPLKRLGLPIDIANATYFLADDESSFITGQTLFVDGGLIL